MIFFLKSVKMIFLCYLNGLNALIVQISVPMESLVFLAQLT